MKPLPIGIQTFRKMIEGNYLYVDKTRNIYELVKYPAGAYFLSRPRRFGKSLLISTLEEIFLGNKELFKGLWIENSDFQWKKHPVLRFDFSKQKAKTPEAMTQFIEKELRIIAKNYQVSLEQTAYYSMFQELIVKLAEKEKVVILIDEYDKAIIDHIENTELAVEMREVMKGFFTILKGNDEYIRFLFLSGVSKFSRAGVFSNLNHLEDITLRDDFSSLLGITEEELKKSFLHHIDKLKVKEKLDDNKIIEKIRHWYNGYRFSPDESLVYNPFSTLLLFKSNRFQHHWFETGTPEFLIKLILKNNYDIIKIPMQVSELSFSSYEVDDISITPLLVQTGYLTIKDYDEELMYYTLDYPNFEVKQAFLSYLMKKIETNSISDSFIIQIVKSIRSDDLDGCISILREVFLSINYDIQIPLEKYYQTIFYLIFTLLGFKIRTEVNTNLGRIDAVIESNSIYIFEFKLYGTKEEALGQIHSKKYYQKYISKGKPVFLVGAEFKDKNIGEYLVEKL